MERKGRRKRNLVTLGFNLSIWVLEVVAGLLYLIPIPFISMFHKIIIVVGLSCGIAPILYIVGMSDVRDSMERYWIIIIRKMQFCCRRNRVAAE